MFLSDFFVFQPPDITQKRRFRQNASAAAFILLLYKDNNFRNIRTIFNENSIGTPLPALLISLKYSYLILFKNTALALQDWTKAQG